MKNIRTQIDSRVFGSVRVERLLLTEPIYDSLFTEVNVEVWLRTHIISEAFKL